MKDYYYLKNSFQTLIITHFFTLMPKYIRKVLKEGSINASYYKNTSILDNVFKNIDSIKRFNTFQELIDTSTDN